MVARYTLKKKLIHVIRGSESEIAELKELFNPEEDKVSIRKVWDV